MFTIRECKVGQGHFEPKATCTIHGKRTEVSLDYYLDLFQVANVYFPELTTADVDIVGFTNEKGEKKYTGIRFYVHSGSVPNNFIGQG